jgi:hypothetical protein
MAMVLANDDLGVTRLEAEGLLDSFFDRIEHERRKVFPETERAG